MSKHKRSCDDHPRFRAGCDPCNAQNRRYVTVRKLAGNPTLSRPAALTVQRLRELRALGYSRLQIAEEAGISPNQVVKLSLGGCDWVQLRVFHGVEQAYTRLRDLPGPDLRAARWAAKHGWEPPPRLPVPEPVDEHSIDEIAVERAVAGEKVPLTRAEAAEAWDRLERMGLSAKQIAARLHTTAKTVHRWRVGAVRPSSSLARKQRTA